MAAGGVAMEDLPQEELGRRDGREQAVAPAGGARLLPRGLARIRVALGGPLRVAAREQARKDLPLSTYTEAYWKIDLHNLLHFLHLRMDEHAQREIRAYAIIIGEEIVAKWVPIVWEAFLDYRKHAVQLSRIEAEIIGALSSKDPEHARNLATRSGLLNRRKDGSLVPNRERRELFKPQIVLSVYVGPE